MKSIKLLCVCFLFGLVACSDSVTTTNNNQNGFNGKWRWTNTVGGIGGWTYTSDKEGYTCTLSISSDSSCSISRNDSVVASGTYSIGKMDSTHFYFALGKGFVDSILYQRLPHITIKSNSGSNPIKVVARTDTITISEEFVADGFETEFVKVK